MVTLLAAWSCDGSGTADVTDESGNGNSFVISTTGLVRVTGHTNQGLSNTGSGPATPPNIGQTADRTFMCWLKGSFTTDGWPIQHYNAAGDTGLFGIVMLSGQVQARGRNAGGSVAAGVTRPSDWATTWHHVASVYDSAANTIRLYLDGTLAASASLTGPLRTDGVLRIFGYTESDIIDDIRVYDAALDQPTIATLKDTPVTGGTIVTDSGTATMTLGATGTQARVATAAGTATLALGASGTATKAASDAGTAPLTLGATGTAAAVRADAGTAALALGADGTSARIATAVGTADATLGGNGVQLAIRAGAGTAVLTLLATGVTPADAPHVALDPRASLRANAATAVLAASSATASILDNAGRAAL